MSVYHSSSVLKRPRWSSSLDDNSRGGVSYRKITMKSRHDNCSCEAHSSMFATWFRLCLHPSPRYCWCNCYGFWEFEIMFKEKFPRWNFKHWHRNNQRVVQLNWNLYESFVYENPENLQVHSWWDSSRHPNRIRSSLMKNLPTFLWVEYAHVSEKSWTYFLPKTFKCSSILPEWENQENLNVLNRKIDWAWREFLCKIVKVSLSENLSWKINKKSLRLWED